MPTLVSEVGLAARATSFLPRVCHPTLVRRTPRISGVCTSIWWFHYALLEYRCDFGGVYEDQYAHSAYLDIEFTFEVRSITFIQKSNFTIISLYSIKYEFIMSELRNCNPGIRFEYSCRIRQGSRIHFVQRRPDYELQTSSRIWPPVLCWTACVYRCIAYLLLYPYLFR